MVIGWFSFIDEVDLCTSLYLLAPTRCYAFDMVFQTCTTMMNASILSFIESLDLFKVQFKSPCPLNWLSL